jgi:hypothetical protein
MPWSRDQVAADAVGVMVDADRIAVCGDVEAPCHLRITDGTATAQQADQMGRVTLLYFALGTLPALRLGGPVRVCDRGPTGAAVYPGTEYSVLDLITRGPFHVASLSLPQVAATGAVYT